MSKFSITLAILIFVILFILNTVFWVTFSRSETIPPEVSELAESIKTDFFLEELKWLSLNVYHEARGEDPFGMYLVALVTLERQNTGRWGNTIEEVVNCPYQFSWVNDNNPIEPKNKKSWNRSRTIARLAFVSYPFFKKYFDLKFYHTKKVIPRWSNSLQYAFTFGNHVFYRGKRK